MIAQMIKNNYSDVKHEKEVTALLVNRDLIIVVNDKFDERKKFDLIRRPTSLKLIDGTCYVADRSGDVYEVRYRTSFYFYRDLCVFDKTACYQLFKYFSNSDIQ